MKPLVETGLAAAGIIVAGAVAISFTLAPHSGDSVDPSVAPHYQHSIPETTLPPLPPHPNTLGAPARSGSMKMTTRDGRGFIDASYDSMPYVLPLNPAGPQDTMSRWVEGLGVSPEKSETGTVYLLGHAWAQQPLVFNPLSETVTDIALDIPSTSVESLSHYPVSRKETDVLDGYRVELKDNEGKSRIWVVSNAYLIDKYEAIDDKDLMDESRPNRLIMIACSVDGSQDLGYNVVVEAYLEDPTQEPLPR